MSDQENAVQSPDILPGPPKKGAGVRRVTRTPLMIVFGVGALVAGVLGYTLMERADEGQARARKSDTHVEMSTSKGVLDYAQTAGLIEAEQPPEPPPAPAPAPAVVDKATGFTRPAQPVDVEAYSTQWQQYRQQQQQVRQQQVQAAQSALDASPLVGGFESASNAGPGRAGAPGGFPDLGGVGSEVAALQELAQQVIGSVNGAGGDPNRAGAKAAWLSTTPDPAGYLQTGRTAQITPYEVKTGTVIPGIMVGGINSDLPGQIIGQVRENVWDSATGKHLLIPQGARLVGTYDNQVSRGQTRVLVAWTRIIYPDGSSLDLGAMPGADQAGYAGFKDKKNNHYMRVFGDAMMLSLFSAGIQLSQPQRSSENGGVYDNQQIIAASIGQQLGQAGMQITQKNLDIQPTLEIRPGYRFNIMVTKDMIIEPWKEG